MEESQVPGSSGAKHPAFQVSVTVKSVDQWNWAAANAGIPQVWDIEVLVSEPIALGRLTISLHDSKETIAAQVAHEGPIGREPLRIGSVQLTLAATYMATVAERRPARLQITLESLDPGSPGKVEQVYREDRDIDIQPCDSWLWQGDPRTSTYFLERQAIAAQDPESPLIEALTNRIARASSLAHGQLASFVRPDHPVIEEVARQATDILRLATGDGSYGASQIADAAAQSSRVEAIVGAVYEALRQRNPRYSEPAPDWDYTREAQRIRDHGGPAHGGLATCVDSSVLLAAVLEHVGLWPLLVLVPGHVFVGYWRRNPAPGTVHEWYPDSPSFRDWSTLRDLLLSEELGVIETTTFCQGHEQATAQEARGVALTNIQRRFGAGQLTVIDIRSARHSGIRPLPVVAKRADGVIEVREYNRAKDVVETSIVDAPLPDRGFHHIDDHPPRIRTWKSSLLTLDAGSPLLNLKPGPSVQPLIANEDDVAWIEDMLHQDKEFVVRSGFDLPGLDSGRHPPNAIQLPEEEISRLIRKRTLFAQRIGTIRGQPQPVSQAKFLTEIRTVIRRAKEARDEKGMNPLFLTIGSLRWADEKGRICSAPLILLPVRLALRRHEHSATLEIDSTSHVTPNVALIEWLKRDHGLAVPELQEPTADRAGIDIPATLAAMRRHVTHQGLAFEVDARARLALLDVGAFRMWQDLNLHADEFLANPLVRHLVHTPLERFEDPAAVDVTDPNRSELLVPVPADAAQLHAVSWAEQGRSFVLQGPPGTGKSQTITNIVAHCASRGRTVMFVAEKQTALEVVQRRLAEVGLGPFMLNLHHEGSSNAQVRQQLRQSLQAQVQSDEEAMSHGLRLLRQSAFGLDQYPENLHARNGAGLSAYSARDRILALGHGPSVGVPTAVVLRQPELLESAATMLAGVQALTVAAGVRGGHPWRLAGPQPTESLDLAGLATSIHGLGDAMRWISSAPPQVRDVVQSVTDPAQLAELAVNANPELPNRDVLDAVLQPLWETDARAALAEAQQVHDQWAPRLGVHGLDPAVLALDIAGMRVALREAEGGRVMGRGARRRAAVAPLAPFSARIGQFEDPRSILPLLDELAQMQVAGSWIRRRMTAVPGLRLPSGWAPFMPGALSYVEQQLEFVARSVSPLRSHTPWAEKLRALVRGGELVPHRQQLVDLVGAWADLQNRLRAQPADLQAWCSGSSLLTTVQSHLNDWLADARQGNFHGLLAWLELVNRLRVLSDLHLDEVRSQLLDGRLSADTVDEAFTRGTAEASLRERLESTGLNRFDPVDHERRVRRYAEAQRIVRREWRTAGPATIVGRRTKHLGSVIGRELAQRKNLLSTRAILKRYGDEVLALTPIVLTSPAGAVDLIEPGTMHFDLVIFDEASQITVPEAIGAMGRGDAAIVVGDAKQMPPSRRVGSAGSVEVFIDEVDEDDEDDLIDQESILTECELAQVPTLSLEWHYRSQDEALISFSNEMYYEGHLSSFPTPTLRSASTGVEFRLVPGGRYLRAGSGSVELGGGLRAGSNTNPAEARAIVAEVGALIDADPVGRPSIGIVTFNGQQAVLISQLLLESADPRIAELADEAIAGRSEYVFVKPLEQVQGDERDIILFSVAFSRQETSSGRSYIPLNFGRLSNFGGERRLNVAVTRARRQNIVFCSFDPEELEAEKSSFLGVKHLKEYLRLAKRHTAGGAEPSLGGFRPPVRDRHRDEIAGALRARGMQVATDVGLSDFRIDLLLFDKDDPEVPVLPVLLDGEAWRRRRSIGDRDVLPVEVLTGVMGWPSVARLWWPMWLTDREAALDRVIADYEAVRGALTGAATSVGGPGVPSADVHRTHALQGVANTLSRRVDYLASIANQADGQPALVGTERSWARPTVSAGSQIGMKPATRVPAPATRRRSRRPKRYQRWRSRRVEPVVQQSTAQLAGLVEEIVAAEGPMLASLAYRRVVIAAGGARIGRAIRDSLDGAALEVLRSGRVSQLVDSVTAPAGKTLYVPGTEPIVVRESGGRDLRTEVPISELRLLMRHLGSSSTPSEEVMRRIMHMYGRKGLTDQLGDFLRVDCFTYQCDELDAALGM